VTYGKIIGAGMPVGAFGGKQEIMDVVSPVGNVYQAGTLSGNPLAMAAGYALLSELHENPMHYDELEEKTVKLATGLKDVLEQHGVPFVLNQVGSMLSIFFTEEEEVIDFQTANTTDQAFFKAYFHQMLENGVYLPPSPFESLFLANSLTEDHLTKTIEAADESIKVALNNV
jgi:glutamate-1-semialdehyde 2,1-aminomutase